MSKKCAVYKCYDSEGRLLYVGISYNPVVRLKCHKSASKWYSKINDTKVIWCDSRVCAERLEYETIRDKNPLHNIQRGTNQDSPAAPMVFSEEEKSSDVYRYIMTINDWLKDTNTNETRFGLLACANGKAVERIRAGSASVNTLRDALRYIEANPA